MTEKTKKMRVNFRNKRRKRVGVTIAAAGQAGVDFAAEGAALADRLYDRAPSGTLDHMLLRLLGRLATEPDWVTPPAMREALREVQKFIAAH